MQSLPDGSSGIKGQNSIHRDSHDIHIIHQREDAEKQNARAIKLAARGIPPQGGLAIFLNDPVSLGEKIFKESCIGCHMVNGEGGETGTDFTEFGSREWVSKLLKDPKDKKYFMESGAVPPVKQPDESLRDMAEFLLSQSGGLHNQNAIGWRGEKNWFSRGIALSPLHRRQRCKKDCSEPDGVFI